MFYTQVSFVPHTITVECKLWCQSSYLMYVLNIEPHESVVYCELWYQMVMFVRASTFARSLHVAVSLWT